jgi:hypothetical protein
MNKPSSTSEFAAYGGVIAGLMIGGMAMAFPEVYERMQIYPGFEAHLGGAFAFLIAWKTKETRYTLVK